MARTARMPAERANEIAQGSWQDNQKDLIDLVRYIATSAADVADLTGAASRDTVYAWSAERTAPTPAQQRNLNTIASLVGLLRTEVGTSAAESATYLRGFNFDQSGTDETTRLERLVNGEVTQIYEETIQHFIERNL